MQKIIGSSSLAIIRMVASNNGVCSRAAVLISGSQEKVGCASSKRYVRSMTRSSAR